LLFSLSFIAFFSYPTVKKTFQIETPNIPLHSLDAQIWQSSVHVQYHNFTLFRHPPSSYLITQQIRISQPENQVGFDLIRKASSIYEAITTSIVELDHGMPVSLSTICYKHQGRCLIYQPPFRSEKEWLKIHSLNRDKYNPLPTFANVTFDNQGRFLKADGILLTFVLKQQTHVNTLRIWNAIWEKVQADLNIVSPDDASATDRSTLYSKADIVSHMIQYKVWMKSRG
jgi:hypothetical protein